MVLADSYVVFTTPYLDRFVFSLLDVIDFHTDPSFISPSLASRGDKRKAFVSKIRSILTTRIRQLFLFKEGRRRGEGKYGGQPEYIEAIPFICLYYTYNIWVSKSVDPGNFSPQAARGGDAIHHTFFFIKLIFFKKSHLSLLSERWRGVAPLAQELGRNSGGRKSASPRRKNSLGSSRIR